MDSDSEEADHEVVPLGEAIRRAISGVHTQSSLADELGVRQNTISRWVTGANTPSLDELREIERLCDRPRGFILTAAGYVQRALSTRDAIAADPGLSPVARQALLASYEVLVGHGDERS